MKTDENPITKIIFPQKLEKSENYLKYQGSCGRTQVLWAIDLCLSSRED